MAKFTAHSQNRRKLINLKKTADLKIGRWRRFRKSAKLLQKFKVLCIELQILINAQYSILVYYFE